MTWPDPLYLRFGIVVTLLLVILGLLVWIVVTNRRWRYMQEADDAERLRNILEVKRKADELAAETVTLAATVHEENVAHRAEVMRRINDLFDAVGLHQKHLEDTEQIVRHELGNGIEEPTRSKIDAIDKTTHDIQKKLDSA